MLAVDQGRAIAMKSRKKLWVVLGIALFLVAGAAIAIPIFLDVNRYRDRVAARLEAAMGKPVEIERLGLTVFPVLSFEVEGIKISNPSGFPKGHLLTAEMVRAELDLRALFRREVQVHSVRIVRPDIRLVSNRRGHWNFEIPTQRQTAPKTVADDSAANFTLGTISTVEIDDGNLQVSSLESGKAVTFFGASGLNADFEDVDLSALDPARASDIRSGWEGLLAALGSAKVVYAAEKKLISHGHFEADVLILGPFRASSARSDIRLFEDEIFFDDLSFNFYDGRATGNLSSNWAGRRPRFQNHVRLSGVNLEKLMEAFPEGRGKLTGTLDGEMDLGGVLSQSSDPLRGLTGNGEVSVTDGRLPSLELGKNLTSLARFAGVQAASGDANAFSSLKADIKIGRSRVTSEKIAIEADGLKLEGRGYFTAAGKGSLNYEGVARLAVSQQNFGSLMATLTGASFADGNLIFPFTITGTFEEPRFRRKRTAPARSTTPASGQESSQDASNLTSTDPQSTQVAPQQPAAPTAEDLVRGLTGLFGRKKQPAEQPK